MRIPVRRLEAPGGNVRVDLCGREVLVTEQLLDDPEVGAAVQEVRGEGVAQGMRRHTLREARSRAEAVETVTQAADAERLAVVVQEQLDGRRVVGVTALEEDRSPVLEVVAKGPPRWCAEEAEPLLAALAEHADLATPEVECAEIGGRQLTDPEPGRVRGLDDRPVAERERDPDLGAARRREAGADRGIVTGRVQVRVDHGQQAGDLFDLQDTGQSTRQPWRGDGTPRIAGRQARARRPPMERADGREPLSDGRASAAVAEDPQVGAQLGARRRPPVCAATGEPLEIGPDGRLIRASSMG